MHGIPYHGIKKTMKSLVPYKGVELFTYGILVKHKHDYVYFKDAIKDMKFRSRAWHSISWNKENNDVISTI